jgi:hypothetical protein
MTSAVSAKSLRIALEADACYTANWLARIDGKIVFSVRVELRPRSLMSENPSQRCAIERADGNVALTGSESDARHVADR